MLFLSPSAHRPQETRRNRDVPPQTASAGRAASAADREQPVTGREALQSRRRRALHASPLPPQIAINCSCWDLWSQRRNRGTFGKGEKVVAPAGGGFFFFKRRVPSLPSVWKRLERKKMEWLKQVAERALPSNNNLGAQPPCTVGEPTASPRCCLCQAIQKEEMSRPSLFCD